MNQDWDELASLVVLSQSSVPLEMLPEMAETLSEFMKAHDLLEQFLKWCIEQEVSSTSKFKFVRTRHVYSDVKRSSICYFAKTLLLSCF